MAVERSAEFSAVQAFDYELPREKIAQRPQGLGGCRSASRLLRLLQDGGLEDKSFRDLPLLLQPGDLLILNDSRVIPCRFFVSCGTESVIEILLLPQPCAQPSAACLRCEALARPMRKLRPGQHLQLSARLAAQVLGRTPDGRRLLLEVTSESEPVWSVLEREGGMPIPPYIRGGRADDSDRELYQTVYARETGSAAAPTAGLHFTPELFTALAERGVETGFLTLHVGPASFLPALEQREMTPGVSIERYRIERGVRAAIGAAKQAGRRVVAVGTTTVRALESACREGWLLDSSAPDEIHETELMITPGFAFQAVDAMITNFHQPGSTHLLLVAAFAGSEKIKSAYDYALRGPYRFLSYGDAMLIEGGAGEPGSGRAAASPDDPACR